ncbi:MAG: hypothetical protein ACUVTQ_06675 [Desulfotomaculales bacterium]
MTNAAIPCPDETKFAVVERLAERWRRAHEVAAVDGNENCGHPVLLRSFLRDIMWLPGRWSHCRQV